MLIKITEPKFTIVFRSEDIVRITPVFLERELDFYFLELSKTREKLKLSIEQVRRLTRCLNCVDLSIDLDGDQTQLLGSPDEYYDRVMSDLLDMAIEDKKSHRAI